MGVSLWAFRLRSCPQGRRAAGYVRNAPTLASARGTPKKISFYSKLKLFAFRFSVKIERNFAKNDTLL
ncbi:MAG: hypothetical protein NZ519_08355 [Bacteroidia bacterium]|nr:hypothetical protein [Bacteroidia bacterium]